MKNIAISVLIGAVALALTAGLSGYGGFSPTLPSTVGYGQVGVNADENGYSVGIYRYVYCDSAVVSGYSVCYDVNDTTTFSTYRGWKVAKAITGGSATGNNWAYAGIACDTYSAGSGGWICVDGYVHHAYVSGVTAITQGEVLSLIGGTFGLDPTSTETSVVHPIVAFAGSSATAAATFIPVKLVGAGL